MTNTTASAVILNTVTLINTFITSFICLVILITLVCRVALRKDVHLLLCTNTYVAILAYSLASGSLYIDALRGDVQMFADGLNDSLMCQIRGSVVLALLSAIFGAFCLLAFFRLCRIVHRQKQFFQQYHIQFIFVIFKWLLSFTFVWFVKIEYLPSEYYCSIPFNTLKPVLLASIIAYGFPSTVIAVIYIRISSYIHYHRLIMATQRRTRRDFLTIQRTMFIVSILWLLGIPSMVLLVYGQVHRGSIHPLTYRIQWITPSFAFCVLSLVLIKFDSRLSSILARRQVVHMKLRDMKVSQHNQNRRLRNKS
ncbi:unnamed protein product [Adineta ricciae]|uniref:G-protein coupled receptors family 1 profile domain-containing protein n=1 Tax=Adineta ricciae TaxID=249248 RepID=A0A814D4E3_ADIRI|nr:unnamed protein product [Adineta ricciae]CAF1453323.1 unnamed protein product [Adineta ricciae]